MMLPGTPRRALLRTMVGCAASLPGWRLVAGQPGPDPAFCRGSIAVEEGQVRLHSPRLQQAVKVLVLADTHLFRDDARGEPFRAFSGRMAQAYNRTRHFRTGAETSPEESFCKALRTARSNGVDLVALAGDIFSFPSEAAIEWAQAKLAEAGVPFLYIAGNHDWHYEGMESPLEELRAAWTRKRLAPLYQGQHPLMAERQIRGVKFVAIDNSTYQIQPEQLAFFRAQVASGLPLVLIVHIPLYAPGRPVGFGCGHPLWGAQTDKNFKIERRPRWPEGGHTRVTLDFHREVFAAPNLLGIFAGHTHRPSLDVVNGIPQFVAGANAAGAELSLEIGPMPPV